MSTLLFFGFGPYQEFPDNITATVLAALPDAPGIHRVIFDVAFDREMFIQTLERIQPAIVIGLGQQVRSEKIQLECCARNVMSQERHLPGRPIEVGAQQQIELSLELPCEHDCERTFNAGSYVCNFSMWWIEKWCQQNEAKFAFVHVPREGSVARVVEYLERAAGRVVDAG